MAGTLFVVATPIGNLEDITLRAIRTLREVDLIAAEDTRRTAKLLAHHQIHRPMISLHAHNEYREAPKLIERISGGVSVALVSDAGTPGISDPGEYLVRLAHERHVRVIPIPGPSSIAAALSVSGQPASEYVFMGFPPRGGRTREAWFERLKGESRTVVAFESPHRVATTIAELVAKLGERQIQVHRELTKIHEQLVISPFSEAAFSEIERGEIVLVVASSEEKGSAPPVTERGLELAVLMVGCMTINGEFDTDTAVAIAAEALHLENAVVRKAWKKHRIELKKRGEALS